MFKMADKIRITSFNCKGFKPRNYDYLRKIFSKSDFLFIQETWLYNFQFNEISNILSNSNYHAVSAMNDEDVGRLGRPHGGCAVVWHRHLKLGVTPDITNSPRICT